MTKTLGGADLAATIRADVAARTASLIAQGVHPKLAVVTATDDESTAWYVRSIASAATRVGMLCDVIDLGPFAKTGPIWSVLTELSTDPTVHGIILQTPLPLECDLAGLRDAIDPDKDVDGANPVSLGRLMADQRAFAPATAQAVMELLDHHQIALTGRNAVVVGRSTVVGTPVAHMLVGRDATVTVCHSRTRDLAMCTLGAEVLVVAVGVPGLITAAHVADGAIVIDVGTTATADGRLVGDVDAGSLVDRPVGLTPVPGGVGPVTTALLLANTVTAATTLASADRMTGALAGTSAAGN
jgi:methylenetetrahydrofolate dehydrogenase (NADP+)/methenyltetrahydrofolate cyclohydrolase